MLYYVRQYANDKIGKFENYHVAPIEMYNQLKIACRRHLASCYGARI